MRHVLKLTAASLVVAACMESPTQPTHDPSFGTASTGSVPFQSRHTSTLGDASGVACDPGQIAGLSVIVKGNATHLGSFSGEAWACLQFTGPLSAVTTTGGLRLVAANGDELYLDMDPADPLLWEISFPEPGVVLVTNSGKFDFAGGTGRFEHATGHVRLASRRVVGEDSTSWMDGEISVPGLSR